MSETKTVYVVQEKEVMTGRNGRRFKPVSTHVKFSEAMTWITDVKASRRVQPTKFRIVKRVITEEVVG